MAEQCDMLQGACVYVCVCCKHAETKFVHMLWFLYHFVDSPLARFYALVVVNGAAINMGV